MKFAVVPWSERELNDEIFVQCGPDGRGVTARQLRDEMVRLGHEMHTYDLYADWDEVDYFLLFPIDWIMANRIAEAGYGDRMVYCNAEPPSVCELHTKKGYETLRQIFPYILTWNPEWVDNQQIFKRCIPYYSEYRPCDIPFAERKLITGISANKHSDYQDELYSVREHAYDYFEAHYPDRFDFYGTGWEGTNHPCYKGTVESKAETFHHYRFALCFENTRMPQDYITEKIWDCLCDQIVPIYLGADNILDYIPEDCFIDYRKFSSCEELAEYLVSIDEVRYQEYLDAAQQLLQSDVLERYFSATQYAQDILNAVSHKNTWQMTASGKRFLRDKAVKERRNQQFMILRHRLKKLISNSSTART